MESQLKKGGRSYTVRIWCPTDLGYMLASGVAEGDGACLPPPPVIAGNCFQVLSDSKSTRFVTIYGFVQSNIQHVSPALPLDPAGDFRPPNPLFCPP